MSKSEKLIRDTILTLIGLGIFGSTNFIFNVVIGRFYGSEFLGEVSAALSTVLLFSYVVSASFPSATSKYISEFLGKNDKEGAGYILKLSIIIPLIAVVIETILVIILSPYIVRIVNIKINVFLWAIPILPLYALYSVLRMIFYGYRNVKEYFKREIISDFVFFGCLAIVIIFGLKNLVYVPFILLYTFFLASSIIFIKGKVSSTHNQYKQTRKKYIIFAGICFIGTFSSMATRSMAIMFSSYYLPLSDVGYLSATFAIANVFFLFPQAIQRVLLPEFSYLHGVEDNERISYILNKSTKYLVFIINIIIILSIIISNYIIVILYSSEFIQATILLQIMLTILWLRMIARPTTSVLTGTKYVHISNIAGFIGFIASIIAWIVFIPYLGIIGSVIGYAIGVLANTTMNFIFAYRYFDLKYSIILKNYAFVLVILFIMIGIPYNFIVRGLASLGILTLYIVANKKIFKNILKKIKGTFFSLFR